MRTWALPDGEVAIQVGADESGKGGVLLVAPKGTDVATYVEQPYVRRLQSLAAAITPKPGELLQANVRHEAWCPTLIGVGLCSCEPDVALRVVRNGGAA